MRPAGTGQAHNAATIPWEYSAHSAQSPTAAAHPPLTTGPNGQGTNRQGRVGQRRGRFAGVRPYWYAGSGLRGVAIVAVGGK